MDRPLHNQPLALARAEEAPHLRRKPEEHRARLRAADPDAPHDRVGSPGAASDASVFLDSSLPRALPAPLHRYLKKLLHPDLMPSPDQSATTRRFQEMRSAPGAIARERGPSLD